MSLPILMAIAVSHSNLPQEVTREKVQFQSGGLKVVGNLFLPAGYQKGAKLPGIVVHGTWTSVKEQMADRYADQMAQKGFVALSFDFRNFGESEGQPRQLESAKLKSADFAAAVKYLQSRSEVDSKRIGGLAICASTAYMAMAIADGTPIKSFVAISSWLHDPQTVGLVYGGEEGIQKRLALSDAAKRKFDETGKVDYVPAQSTSDANAAMAFPIDFYENPSRGNVSAWTNQFATMGWREWLTIDMISPAAKVKAPTLIIHSEKAALPDNARRFYEKLAGPKQIVWAPGEHTDFYDQPTQVRFASSAAAGHFAKTLMTPAEVKALAETSIAGTREFLAALEAKDVERFLAVWADDGVQEMPYSPSSFPAKLDGKEAIRKQYGGLPEMFESMKFPVQRITATEDPNTVIAEFTGNIQVKATAGKYDNSYVGVFTFSGGKLKHYTEYFNPALLERAFGPQTGAKGQDEIVPFLEGFAKTADSKDWAKLRAMFADKVAFDYTSVAGGEPAVLNADDIVAGWKQGLGRYKQTKHHFSDLKFQIVGGTAICQFTGQATHVRDENGKEVRWSCGGDYLFHLARTGSGWRISSAKFDMKWEQGER